MTQPTVPLDADAAFEKFEAASAAFADALEQFKAAGAAFREVTQTFKAASDAFVAITALAASSVEDA